MRVCHVLGGNEEGGLEKHVVELCNGLADMHEVHVIAHEKYDERFDKSVYFHPLDLSRSRRDPWILYGLYGLLKEIDAKIIHAHANKAAAMVSTLHLFLPKHMKRVATLHSQKRDLAAFETFDHVIGVSHAVIAPLKKVATSVVYNGIDLPEVESTPDYLLQCGIGQDAFVLCAIGRMEKVKRFDILLQAMKELDVQLLLVGEGSQKRALQQLADTLKIAYKVHFLGHRDDVANLLSHSDVCVISSEREGFSYVMAEALLLETPVLSTDVGDMRRILPTAYVVPAADTAAMAKKIADMQHDAVSVRDVFGDAFAFAKTHFTAEAMVQGVCNVYDKVAEA